VEEEPNLEALSDPLLAAGGHRPRGCLEAIRRPSTDPRRGGRGATAQPSGRIRCGAAAGKPHPRQRQAGQRYLLVHRQGPVAEARLHLEQAAQRDSLTAVTKWPSSTNTWARGRPPRRRARPCSRAKPHQEKRRRSRSPAGAHPDSTLAPDLIRPVPDRFDLDPTDSKPSRRVRMQAPIKAPVAAGRWPG
jgi:hypothetical protein